MFRPYPVKVASSQMIYSDIYTCMSKKNSEVIYCKLLSD